MVLGHDSQESARLYKPIICVIFLLLMLAVLFSHLHSYVVGVLVFFFLEQFGREYKTYTFHMKQESSGGLEVLRMGTKAVR